MLTAFDRGPGLYWRDGLPLAEHPWTSGIAGFVGILTAASGADVAALVNTSHALFAWEELEPLLGGVEADSTLLAAVKGFFQNGGRRCQVVFLHDTWSRLADETERQRLIGAAFEAGLQLLEDTEEIDLVAAPFLMGMQLGMQKGLAQRSALYELQKRLLSLCARRGDCFALLDSPSGTVSALELKAQWSVLSSHEGAANAALYYPWVRVPGGCRTCLGTGVGETGVLCRECEGTGAAAVPPCGHVAGIFARVDARTGVFRAPANEEIEGIVDLHCTDALRTDALQVLSRGEQEVLAGVPVNLLRAMPGRGLRVWGARTLSKDPSWQWISVRRLFLNVRRWLEHTMVNVVFEPNDFRLWIRIDRELTAYCEQLYRVGALKGQNANEAFFVRCNAETNPVEVRDAGKLVVEIGLAPTVPKEFIVIRLVRGVDGVMVTE